MSDNLRCEHCKCSASEAALEHGGWLTATEHAHHDDVALCRECIQPYAQLENEYLEHAWHTLVAITQQALVDDLDVTAPATFADLCGCVIGLTGEMERNADRRVYYQLAKEQAKGKS